MNTTSTSSVRFAPVPEWKVQILGGLLKRQTLQRIASTTSLISQAIGFSVVGLLIILNRHQSDPNGLSGGGFVAMVGGIGAVFVGAIFFVAVWLYCRSCARRSAGFSASRQARAASSLSVQGDSPGSRSLRLSWHLLPG
ncbi:MAG TPA: hypothetical protein VFO40_19520 [Chthoniobacterales bacterium]|nr:hypothetical protein [Chthoniobacterales bacterium]